MASKKKLLQAAAGSAGSAGLDIDEVFSTYLYDGTGSQQTIVNNIDLSGEGGMVWTKSRSNSATDHHINDTVRGADKALLPNGTFAEQSSGLYSLNQFNSNGFRIDGGGNVNASGQEYASWTWRKAPKFFDVVTYTGNGSFSQTINHSLGCEVGAIWIKRRDSGANWLCAMRVGTNSYKAMYLNKSDAAVGGNFSPSANTERFVVGGNWNGDNVSPINTSGATYVAYVFAHNDGDGGFGPSSDQDIIKCGTYAGNGATAGPEINLGFEPQWVIIKNASNSGSWTIVDAMRGAPFSGVTQYLTSNSDGAENPNGNITDFVNLTSTGFSPKGNFQFTNTNGENYMYIAIRRGPLADPTSATDVFAMDSNGLSANSEGVYFTSNFPVDFTINKERTHTSDPWIVMSRLQGNGNYIDSTGSSAEATGISNGKFDRMTGWMDSGSAMMSWMWKRAPNYFDVVCHTGDGTTNRAIAHNLGQVPRLRITKSRDNTLYSSWWVYYIDGSGTQTRATLSQSPFYANSDVVSTATNIYPTSTVTNASGIDYVNYLFGEISGISKISTYTGNGGASAINVDCGFSSGARFVLIKSKTESTNWIIYDSVRGIVSGNDPYVLLNATAAEVTNTDYIDPLSSGFTVSTSAPTSGILSLNANNVEYVFYAIA